MDEKTNPVLVHYYLRRVIARIVVPKPARRTRAEARKDQRPR